MTKVFTQVIGTTVSNAKTTEPFRFEFQRTEDGKHTVVVGPTGKGMSVLSEAMQDESIKAGGSTRVTDKGPSLK